MRRAFSNIQRLVLAELADWKCQICGCDLRQFHADHIKPWSKGGPTTIDNGQALCPPCNLKKGDRYLMDFYRKWVKEARLWQREAMDRYEASQSQTFLLCATPGAGKTRFSCGVSVRELSHQCQRVIVVCPSLLIRRQWKEDMAEWGIQVSSKPENFHLFSRKNFRGFCLTYQALSMQGTRDAIRAIVSKFKTLVILDEVHHCGDDNVWGEAVKDIFSGAQSILSLSGTPFRTDKTTIPFVNYRAIGSGFKECIPDYNYSYGQALMDDPAPVRPVVFARYSIDGHFFRNGNKIEGDISDGILAEQDVNTLVSIGIQDPDWAKDLFSTAHSQLLDIRKTHPDAAGMVTCKDQQHAEKISRYLKEVTGENPELVISDLKDSAARIKAFKSSRKKWIVAVQMVSEGVDIPRLRVALYLTNIKTRQNFYQVVGRVVRKQRDCPCPKQTAYCYIYDHPMLNEFAREMENAVSYAKEMEELFPPSSSGIERSPSSLVTGDVNGDLKGYIVRDLDVDPATFGLAAKLASVVEGKDESFFINVLQQSGFKFERTEPVTVAVSTEVLEDRIESIRSLLKRRVGYFCRVQDKYSHSDVNRMLSARTGAYSSDATIEQLEKRRELLEEWIAEGDIR